ncbi:MAG: cobalt ECF transporter T component CbiQ [Lachnospiraceae bacterium]|nr:cobalt ECF transporter T component CbiQ [Lachnospiraceae bacterium]
MADIRNKISKVYSFEQMSRGNSIIHRVHPMAKIIVTVIYILCVAMHTKYRLLSLSPLLFYPVVVTALAEIPGRKIFAQSLVALPFCLFAGISNIIFDKKILVTIGVVAISGGVISSLAIIARCLLCVSAVLILVATTPFAKLTAQLVRMHVPVLFVRLIEMVYRYLGVLVEEAYTMIMAYRLRSPGAKWPHIKDAGSFLGQLFVRSMNRAERVYQAMVCRGYESGIYANQNEKMKLSDYLFMMIVIVPTVFVTLFI